jgi:hypothetical protein
MTSDLAAFAPEEPSATDQDAVSLTQIEPAAIPASPGKEGAVPRAVLAFTRSRSRTPHIVLDSAPTSTLFSHQSQASVDQPTPVVPARPSAKDIAGDIRKHAVLAFEAFAERLRPVLRAMVGVVGAIPSRLRPLAKPLAVFAIAALAISALVVSGRLLVMTIVNPSQSAATPAAASEPVAKVADVPPVARARNAAPRGNAAPSNSVSASNAPAAAPAATPEPAPSSASISERASAAVTRAFDAILPPANPRRTTSIVLEPNPGGRRTAAPSSARAASASAKPAPSSQSAVAPSSPSEPSSPIELQAAAPPAAPESSQLSSDALPAAVMPKYPMPPPAPPVYSSNDVGVVPPVQTYPRYVESIGPNHPNASPFQVVIDENGLVESAVLARYPVDMRQAVSGTMLLSAAKAWRFQPATKDGQPVKYRRVIWFSNQ